MSWQKGLTSPGLGIAALIALAASLVPLALGMLPAPLDRLPVSPILVAILLGLALAGLARDRARWQPGIKLAAGPLLKLAVMLIGLRLSLDQMGQLGVTALPLVVAAIATGLGLAWLMGRLLGTGSKLTALLAVGSAICGASAIAAAAPALKPRSEETAYALACVALIGLAATVAYPALAHGLVLQGLLADGQAAGLVLGAAIHDTAQVTGAAILYEQTFTDSEVVASATVTKLLRNLGMLVVIPLVVFLALRGQEGASSRPPFPLFILGFIALAGLRTVGDGLFGQAEAWTTALAIAGQASTFLFAMAMAAIGMSIRIGALRALGLHPALVAVLVALGMAAVSVLLAGWLV